MLLFGRPSSRPSLTELLSRMNEAAVDDYRAVIMWPAVARVLAPAPRPARSPAAADLVTAWGVNRGRRLDLDNDGKLDDPGAIVLDRAWPGIAEAVMAPRLGATLDRFRTVLARDRLPATSRAAPGTGSAGRATSTRTCARSRCAVRGRLRTRLCGKGDLAACRASLWAAVDAAARRLASEQGPDPAAWRADEARDGSRSSLASSGAPPAGRTGRRSSRSSASRLICLHMAGS